jgi:transposase
VFVMIREDWGMAKRYRPAVRDQPFLLPPDMREWLPAGHLAWFVIDAVAALDLSRFSARQTPAGSWAGRAAFDPAVLLGLLVYGYATGVRSSRRIERACSEDVAFRVICAQDVPDHATVARFRREHFADPGAVESLFAQVLALAARAGLGKLGLVAVDGTKIAAAASKDANRTGERLRALARQILDEAEAADAAEDELHGPARGDELPAELADPVTRKDRIAAALAELEAERTAEQDAKDAQAEAYLQRAAARRGGQPPGRAPAALAVRLAEQNLAAARAARAAQLARLEARRGAGEPAPGRQAGAEDYCRVRQAAAKLERARARAAEAAAREDDRAGPGPARNITDPHSRLMPVRGGGFIQGYNAQAIHSADGLCLGTLVTQNTTDYASFEPMMAQAQAASGLLRAAARGPLHRKRATIGTVLADAGYLSEHNLTLPGPDRLIATGKRRDLARASGGHPATPAGGRSGDATAAMAARLAAGPGRAAYRRRGPLAEGPFGDIKNNRGFRRFSLRGLQRVTSEWAFQNIAANLLKIYHARQPALA